MISCGGGASQYYNITMRCWTRGQSNVTNVTSAKMKREEKGRGVAAREHHFRVFSHRPFSGFEGAKKGGVSKTPSFVWRK